MLPYVDMSKYGITHRSTLFVSIVISENGVCDLILRAIKTLAWRPRWTNTSTGWPTLNHAIKQTASGITLINRNLTIKPFVKRKDNKDTAVQWQKHKKEISWQFRFFGISYPETEKDGLLIYSGQGIVDTEATKTMTLTKFSYGKSTNISCQNKIKISQDFRWVSLTSERFFYTRLMEITKKCNYGTH